MADTEELEQRIAQLTDRLAKVEAVFARFMREAYTPQRDFLMSRVMPVVAAFENGELPKKTKRSRKPLNQDDHRIIQGMLDNDGNAASWKYIAEQTGIPQSTCRKYAKMSPEEVLALPLHADDDEGE